MDHAHPTANQNVHIYNMPKAKAIEFNFWSKHALIIVPIPGNTTFSTKQSKPQGYGHLTMDFSQVS